MDPIDLNEFYTGAFSNLSPYELTVKRSNAREYLIFCAKVAAAETAENKELLFRTALHRKVFQCGYKVFRGEEDSAPGAFFNEDMAGWFTNKCDNMIFFVKELSRFINRAEPFDLYIKGIIEVINVRNKCAEGIIPGKITIHPRPDKNESFCLLPRAVTVEIVNDDSFIPAILRSIDYYMKKKEIQWLQLPLRICDWCSTPFFGNRQDQRFCSKIHGQRWHAERSNAVKREQAMIAKSKQAPDEHNSSS